MSFYATLTECRRIADSTVAERPETGGQRIRCQSRLMEAKRIGDLPKNCRLLPSAAILEPQNRYVRFSRCIPYMPAEACLLA